MLEKAKRWKETMTEPQAKPSVSPYHWILFFYSVPSKPVSNRMTVWRKLIKAGAIPLKGAVYILPFTPEHYELLRWLVAEIKAMNGDGAVVSIDKVDTISEGEIIELFNQARKADYLEVEHDLDEVARKVNNIKKGGQGQTMKGLAAELDKIGKALAEIHQIDFFAAPEGLALRTAIDQLHHEVNLLLAPQKRPEQTAVLKQKLAADYHGRVWATRERPFVDRMACAWLIRHHIDQAARFEFIDEGEMDTLPATTIVFDMFGGEFTHSGDLCTFEVLLRAFGLKDKALKQIAEVVHDLDMKDAKYQSLEALGVEHILTGIRKTAADDAAALEQGMQVFAMLYAAKKS